MDKDIIADAKEKFALAHSAESENRKNALDDIRFARLGEQWDDDDRRVRQAQKRPMLTINRMPAFARQIVNDARQNKPSIRVRPADSNADPKTADIYNGLIRNIEQTSDAEVAYDTALEWAVYGGFGYFRIRTDYAHDDSFDLDILIERIANPFTVYGDPASQAADASDWRFGFITDLIELDEFKAKWGKNAATVDWSADGDDKDRLWREEESVRVAEFWDRSEVKRPIVQLSNGQVLDAAQYESNRALWDMIGVTVTGERETRSWEITQYTLTGAEVLSKTRWAGKYIPIVPVYGDEVNVEGKRYFRGIVRDARDAQKMYNYWRTITTELVALSPKAPFIGPAGAFDSDSRWQTANSEPHATLEYDPVPGQPPPQRQPFAGVPAGALQEALNASDDMKSILGMYDASLGARSNETSGRAILARQREGDVSTFHYVDNLSRAIRYAGRVLLDLIPAVYDKPRMVRVLGEDGTPRTVMVNGQPQDDPHGHVYELARGKYDLMVETGPSFTTRREEAATFLLETMRANPQTAPILMDVVAKNQDFPEADVVARRFKAMLPPPIQALEGQGGDEPDVSVIAGQLAQAQQAMQAMQQQLQQAAQALQGKQAEVAAKEREAQAQLALEQHKAAAQLQLEREMNAQRIQLEREKAAAMRELEIEKALIAAGVKRDIAAMDAQAETQRAVVTAAMQPEPMEKEGENERSE